MKNQYYADVNDYRKYGLLRGLVRDRELTLGVAWMLTPDDSGPDGRFTDYAADPTRWREYDPPLFDHLADALSRNARNVTEFETSGLLPDASFFRDVVPDDHHMRVAFSDRLTSTLQGNDLVFLDPDNGIEVSSKPAGRKGSRKFVLWRELHRLFEVGTSLLIYQHYPRKPRQQFHIDLCDEFMTRLGCSGVSIIATSNVAFILAAHERHQGILESNAAALEEEWPGQLAGLWRRET